MVSAVKPDPSPGPAGEDVFEAFFDANYENLLRVMYLILGDRYEAEDLAQEAFVKAFERWDKIRRVDNPTGYVYRIALNAHRSRLRRITVAAKHSVVPRESDPISETDDRDAVRRALAQLPEPQRAALVLTEWLELSSEEAGQILGVSGGAVRVRVSRAKQSLRLPIERAAT